MPSRTAKGGRGKKMSQYDQDKMDQAVKAVKDGTMSVREASNTYEVPKSTLQDRVSNKHSNIHGRPTVLSKEEEEMMVLRLGILAKWGYPMTETDLRFFVKAYLDKKGAKTIFKDNLPTRKFVYSFLGRHQELNLRRTNLIKRSRAGVTRKEVAEFFKHFQVWFTICQVFSLCVFQINQKKL